MNNFYLMNKDKIVLGFSISQTSFSDDVSFVAKQSVQDKLPYGFTDITSWIEQRKGLKHNKHLTAIMKRLGCDDNLGFIKITHAAGINDTFWIKNENENITWNDISLYRNQFSEVVSKLAFEGVGLHDELFSPTSPELSSEGSFRKCFIKEKTPGEFGSDIFLYKRGHELGEGLEPYCEMIASQIAQIVSPGNTVSYSICSLHDKLASRCNLFTNETLGYASYAKISKTNSATLQNAFEFFEGIKAEQSFREMLVVDALCFNQDRHQGNYGVLFDNDTLEIKRMAPIFDLNICCFPYVRLEEFKNIGDKLYEYAPKLGDDFTRIGQIAVNDIIRDRLKDVKDFTFNFEGDDVFTKERLKNIESVVQKQAKALLSHEKLYTKDVFFSQLAVDQENHNKDVLRANECLDKAMDILEKHEFKSDGLLSICTDDTAVLYFEGARFQFAIDFVHKEVVVTKDCVEIDMDKLRALDPLFYNDVMFIVQTSIDVGINLDNIKVYSNKIDIGDNGDFDFEKD